MNLTNKALLSSFLSILLYCHVKAVDVKIMSFNVRTSHARDPCPAGCWWPYRAPRCLAVLKEHHPDFVGTQETSEDQRHYLTHHGHYSSIGSPTGTAILYKAQKWHRLQDGLFYLSDTPHRPSNTWGYAYTRFVTWGRFRSTEDHRVSLCLFNVHFDYQGHLMRGSRLVARMLGSICHDYDHVVLSGDLNTVPRGGPVAHLLRSQKLQMSTAEGTWMHGFHEVVAGALKFDYVLFRPKCGLGVIKSQVIRKRYSGYYPSDHALVMTTFSLARC